MTQGQPAKDVRHPPWKHTRPPALDGIPPSVLHLPARGGHLLLLDHLTTQFPGIDRETWAKRLSNGLVLAPNGQPLAVEAPTPAGQWIWYYRTPENEQPIPFAEKVLFQDAWLVVADKPHFLPVTPAGRYARETLLARLQRRLHLPHLAPLHRIDRETAGLVVFTVQPDTRDAYARLFRERRVQKTYEAIAVRNPSLNLTAPLLRTSHLAPHACDFFRMAEYPAKAANSSTWIEQLEDLPGDRVRLRLHPFTGLRHQLRVHLDALGMPIVGDQLYPHVLHDAIALPDYRHPLQLLAQCLAFTDPLTGQARLFQSQMTLLQR